MWALFLLLLIQITSGYIIFITVQVNGVNGSLSDTECSLMNGKCTVCRRVNMLLWLQKWFFFLSSEKKDGQVQSKDSWGWGPGQGCGRVSFSLFWFQSFLWDLKYFTWFNLPFTDPNFVNIITSVTFHAALNVATDWS